MSFFEASFVRRSALAVAIACTGCVSATFHSKTGQTYPSVTSRAVLVADHDEAAIVWRLGAPIGTISSDGTTDKNTADLADKAAVIAAQNGGTHVLLSSTGTIDTTTTTPASETRQRTTDADGNRQCQAVYTPEQTSTSSRPTADFVVLRVEPQAWAQLPASLRPAAHQ